MITEHRWAESQEFERGVWGWCTNTYDEETKQIHYAQQMGMSMSQHWYRFDNKSILDVGGGPCSMLIKTWCKRGKVIDPCHYPPWIAQRYQCCNIEYDQIKAEDMQESGWDEVWLYNVLQHVIDPERIISNCLKAGKTFRIFEYINVATDVGHPHVLTSENLDKWIGQQGSHSDFEYWGVFH